MQLTIQCGVAETRFESSQDSLLPGCRLPRFRSLGNLVALLIARGFVEALMFRASARPGPIHSPLRD